VSGPLRFIDLFAGVGGLTEGFRAARASDGKPLFEPLLLVDTNAAARETQLRNHPGTKYLLADIGGLSSTDLRGAAGLGEAESVDVLIGGPPCQGFSKLNKLVRQALDDPRNAMFGRFLEIVREMQPRFVLIENVPNLLDFDGGRYRDEAFLRLAEAGYSPAARILSANEFGLPQLRKRAFIAAVRSDVRMEVFDFPKGRFPPLLTAREVNAAVHGDEEAFFSPPFVSVEEAIGDLPPLNLGDEAIGYSTAPFSDYQAARRRGCRALSNHTARNHDVAFIEKKLKKIKEGGSNQDLDGRSRFDRGREIKYLSQAYGRLHRSGIAQTITAHFANPGSGRFLHYRDHRSITVREAARFQGFDDSFVFFGKQEAQQRQVGNAVPPLLSRVLGEHFGRMLVERAASAAAPAVVV
jgi:DNA (cytosine-5)-methyltransferase 1